MYTGLRVGISVAQGLARALSASPPSASAALNSTPTLTPLDAAPIIAIHRAGRGELAWASYQGNPWRELTPPRLSKPEELAEAIPDDALVTGEVDEALADAPPQIARQLPSPPPTGRARSLATLAYPRLEAGETAEPALLRPIYLRPPAIGPQKQSAPVTIDR